MVPFKRSQHLVLISVKSSLEQTAKKKNAAKKGRSPAVSKADKKTNTFTLSENVSLIIAFLSWGTQHCPHNYALLEPQLIMRAWKKANYPV